MEKKFYTYADAIDSVISSIKARKVDLDTKHILIVPKTHTLFFERALAEGNNGYFDIEVLSLSRLYYKLCNKPLLSKEGAVMLLRQILNEVSLECFTNSYPSFCSKLYDTISRLYISGVRVEDIKAEDGLKIKLDDIKKIYERFLVLSEQVNIEKGGMVNALIKSDKLTEYFINTNVYVLNFDCLSGTEQQLFDLISDNCKNYIKTEIIEGGKIDSDIEIYPASNRAEAIKAVSRRIILANRQGIDYEDMCVICALDSLESVKRILLEYQIPFHADIKISLSSHSLTRYLLDLINLKSINKKDIISLAKNPFSKIDYNKAEIFENYINKFSANYLSFDFEFSDKTAEEVRKKSLNIINLFWRNIRKVKSKEEFCLFIEKFVDSLKEGKIDKYELVKNKIGEILDLILRSYYLEFNLYRLIEIFILAIDSSFLHPLPPLSKSVMISSPVAFRGKRHKYTFIMDFNEGVMPLAQLEYGIINENDFKEANINLTPSLEKINLQNEIELKQILYSSKNIFISYIDSASMRPSPLIYQLKGQNKVVINNYLREMESLDFSLTEEELVDFASCKKGALEHLLLLINKPTIFTASLYEVLKEDVKKFLFKKQNNTISKNIFFKSNTTSVSQLQTYFDCPYKHFIKYGLRAKDDERGEISFLDIGLIVHSVMEKFCLCDFNEDLLDGIIMDCMEEFKHKQSFILGYQERLIKQIKELCIVFKCNIKKGKFINHKCEQRVYPIDIDGLSLAGSIDYLDFYNDYVRIIDYKTSGKIDLEAKHIYYGLKLQLPLYMQSLIENGYRPAALVYFPFKAKFDHLSNLIGIFNNDLDVVLLSDSDLINKQVSDVLTAKIRHTKKGISVTGGGGKKEEEIIDICKRTLKTAIIAVKQIKEGNIEPNPYVDSRKTSCSHCKYSCACRFNSVPRNLIAPSKSGGKNNA